MPADETWGQVPEAMRKGGRGSRSEGTAERFVTAAMELLSEGAGLEKLGLTREAICARSGDLPGTFDYHFGPRSGRSLRVELARRVHESLLAELVANVELYATGYDAVDVDQRRGALREATAAALRRDLADFDPARAGPEGRARERLYYVMVALCDLAEECTGVDYFAVLSDAHAASMDIYRVIYERMAERTGREFVDGVGRTQRAVDVYLEGVCALQRFGRAPSHEEIVDTVLRLFLITTKRRGGHDIDVDGELLAQRI